MALDELGKEGKREKRKDDSVLRSKVKKWSEQKAKDY